MHGQIAKPKNVTDRSAIMRAAWKLWRLANELAERGPYDGNAIEFAARAAGASYQGAIDARNAAYRQYRSVKGIATFGDALRRAWAERPAPRPEPTPVAPREPITGFAAERMAANCLGWGMEAERLRRLKDIARREAATA